MPLIQVTMVEDVFTADEKKDLIGKITDAVVAVKGENLRPVTWVVIEEVASGAWGMGGQAITSEAVRAIIKG